MFNFKIFNPMSLRYKPKAIKSVTTDQVKYYAQVDTRYKIDFETLAEEIEKLTSLTAGDALNMLRTMQYLVIQHLSNTETVFFDQLGTFMPTITSSASLTAEKVTAGNIKSVRVRFVTGSGLKKALQISQLTFTNTGAKTTANDEEATA